MGPKSPGQSQPAAHLAHQLLSPTLPFLGAHSLELPVTRALEDTEAGNPESAAPGLPHPQLFRGLRDHLNGRKNKGPRFELSLCLQSL